MKLLLSKEGFASNAFESGHGYHCLTPSDQALLLQDLRGSIMLTQIRRLCIAPTLQGGRSQDRPACSTRGMALHMVQLQFNRSELEVASGSASQLDNLHSHSGGLEEFSGFSLAQGTGRRLKAMSEWSLEGRSRAGSEHGIAATVCPWQTASEAAALLLLLVKPATD